MDDRLEYFIKNYPKKEEETNIAYNNRRRAFAVNGLFNEEYLKGNEHGIVHSTIGNVLPEIKVNNLKQIHILGSKQDIEGFKTFMKNPIKSSVKYNSLSKDFDIDNIANELGLDKKCN